MAPVAGQLLFVACNHSRFFNLPGDLKARIAEFVGYYNTERYHEILNNLMPEVVYAGRGQTILNRRMRIKQKIIEQRRRLYYRQKLALL